MNNALRAETPALGRADYEPADYTSREGAEALKDRIEAYWRARGMTVMLSLQHVGFHPAIRAARFDVRSDMVNGLPRTALQQAHRKPANDDDRAAPEAALDVDDVWLD